MHESQNFVLHGDIVYSQSPHVLSCLPGGWLVCEEGRVAGAFETLPQKYQHLPLQNHSGSLIVPGLVDLHLHAPQYPFLGLGMDLELLDWLQQVTFPYEARFEDLGYAKAAYQRFTAALVEGPTTRACVFATIHLPATLLLMDLLEKSGLACYVGKVNMDRNSPENLCEECADTSLAATEEWLESCHGRYQRTRPILTPRFIPSCSNALLQGLAALKQQTGLPLQSHLAENPSEVALVNELCPEAKSYADAYDRLGLLDAQTIMAHCVWPAEGEIPLLRERGVFVAHCPNSNANLSSGIAPVRQYLNAGVNIGLGSDISGGAALSLFRVMADAIQHSKLRWRLVEGSGAPLTMPEAFWLATRGGGAFFGRVGAFEPGYAFDALVLDDSRLLALSPLDLQSRLERLIYLAENSDIRAKYVEGRRVK